MVNINKLRKIEKAKKKEQSVAAASQEASTLSPDQESPIQKRDSVQSIPEPKMVTTPVYPEKTLRTSAVMDENTVCNSEVIQSTKVNVTTGSTIAMEKAPAVMAGTDLAENIVAETKELITFRLESRLFGIFVDNVHSVVKPSHITRVPQVEEYLVGIMNLRGIITPIYDLKRRFDIGASLITDKTRIMIIEYADNLVGFLVDEIANLHNISLQAIQPAPEIAVGVNQRYVQGVVALPEQEELIIIIAPEEIVRSKERTRVGHSL